MRAWWGERTTAERRLLLSGALVVAGALYFLFIVEPLRLASERHAAQLRAEQALARHLATVTAEVARLDGSAGAAARLPDGASLLAVVTDTARAAGVQEHTRRMTPVGARALSVVVEDVVFGRLAGWLGALERDYGISAERASIEADARAGVVDAELTLAAPP